MTVRILGRLDLLAVANELQLRTEFKKFTETNHSIALEHAELAVEYRLHPLPPDSPAFPRTSPT